MTNQTTFDNLEWSMINQEDNCTIRIVYLVLFCHTCNAFAASEIAYFVNNWFPGQMVHTRAFSFLLILKQTSDWTNQVKWVGQSISDLVNKHFVQNTNVAPVIKLLPQPRLFSAVCLFQELGIRAGRRTSPLEKDLTRKGEGKQKQTHF